MKRREFVKLAAASTAGVLLGGCSGSLVGSSRSKSKPNIVFIMADDLGCAHLGCYGGKKIMTPSIDRMAGEGLRFTQTYAGHCVCAPSRSVLMTGQHTGHTTVRDNGCKTGGDPDEESGRGCRLPLKQEDVTVAEVLKKAGYATGITGKWGLGEAGSTGVPNRQGFDEWFGYLNQNMAVYYYLDYLWRNEERFEIPANKNNAQQVYTHDLLADFALDFIREHKHGPFFLYAPFTIPHFNHEVPSIEPYEDKPWKKKEKIFAAMITRMDKDVGRILDLLKELDIDRETIVFFCSDNGGIMNGTLPPFKGGKGSFNEGGIQTPMVVRWPSRIAPGTVSDAQWYFADVMPTLADLAGVKPPDNIDGVSVLPTLLGKKQPELPERFMYWEKPGILQQAARWRDWKVIRRKKGESLELYDLATDPGEVNNVAEKNPQVVAFFEEYLKTA
ncbi:MAG: sulfatase-like hydrolase/transferase, partial [Planctomycetota bacterium]